jgi:WS/DGAT/MGAT family acyltransferase
MQQLSGLDAQFLYLETPKSPMHIGGVYIYAPPKEGEMNFEIFRKSLEARLHISRTFRQRIVESPLNLGHPYWIEDPNFELNNHIFHTALPKPGGRKELRALASRIFSRQLDRSKPLWEFTYVEGLENIEKIPKGSFALITKVHHAAIDGGSGAEILAALLNPSPEMKPIKEPKSWIPERIPSSVELLTKNYFKSFGTPFKLAKFVYDTAQNSFGVAREVIDKAIQPPPMPFTAPSTIFNASVSARRVFGGTEFSLEKIKTIKNATVGVTINDTVLAICAGGLRKYLLSKDKLPKKSLVAMAPISVRSGNQKNDMGNEVSSMLVSLATHEPDPVHRLNMIHASTRGSKAYSKAIEANKLMNFVPSTLAALASKLYTRMKFSEVHTPFYNLVITNVPGPSVPLYMNGAPLITQFGTAPVLDGLGILLVVLSYNGRITISVTCTPELMPDVEVFLGYLQESCEELYQALVVKAKKGAIGTEVTKSKTKAVATTPTKKITAKSSTKSKSSTAKITKSATASKKSSVKKVTKKKTIPQVTEELKLNDSNKKISSSESQNEEKKISPKEAEAKVVSTESAKNTPSASNEETKNKETPVKSSTAISPKMENPSKKKPSESEQEKISEVNVEDALENKN